MHLNTIRKLLKIPNYKVTKIIFQNEKEIHLKLEPYKNNIAQCSGCGRGHVFGYHSSKEVPIQDIPLSERKVFLHIEKRRYRCPEDERIRTEELEWARPGARLTKRFEEQINRLTAITTNQEAGWFLDLDDEKVYRADKKVLEEKAEEKLNPTPAAINLSVDEVSYRKYHNYLTNVIDVDIRKVIWNAKGRKSETLNQYYENIGEENCNKIESVALDGAQTYISSTINYAKNAMIIYDKFHLVQKLNNAVDEVRKKELRQARANKDSELEELINCKRRFILLKKTNKLTAKQNGYLNKIYEINKPIYKAMLLKESFLQIYNLKTFDDAKDHLEAWLNEAKNSPIEIFQLLAEKLTNKMIYILNWFKKKISSAISEGFNNKIKRLKRMAYGYRDIDYFMLKIHQHCGLLNPRLAT